MTPIMGLATDRARRLRRLKPALRGATALAMLLAAGAAHGQDTPASAAPAAPATGSQAAPLVLDQMTVTATGENAWGPVRGFVARDSATGTKTDTPLIETPQSISVITRDQLDAQGVRTVNDALRYTAGVGVENRGTSTRYDGVMIRGFGGRSVASQPTYLDGLLLPKNNWYAAPQIDPFMLERIEVIKGPASVLYGQTPPGGMVNLVSKRPPDAFQNEVQLQFGSHDDMQGAFDIGGPLDQDGTFLYRLIGVGRMSDTQTDNTREQRVSISPEVTWRPNADTTLTVLLNYQRDPQTGPYGWLPAQGTVLRNPNGRIPTSVYDGDTSFDQTARTQYSAAYMLEHRVDDTWTLRQNLRYMHVDFDYNQVYGSDFTTSPDGRIADYRTIDRGTARSRESFDTIAIDSQAQATFDTGPLQHTMLFGVDYRWLDSIAKTGFGNAPPIDIYRPDNSQSITMPPLATASRSRVTQLGLYAQDQIRFGGLVLTAGIRHDWAETSVRDRDIASGDVTRAPQSDRAFTGRVGLLYLFDSGIAPYASWSTSFEPQAGTSFDHQPFKPLNGEQFEVGVKYQPPGMNSLITLSAFQIRQENGLTPDPAHTGYSIQTGEIRSRGVEFEGKLSLTDELSLIGTATWLDVEVTKANDATRGKWPVAIPNRMASLWADYTFQDGPLSGLGLGGGVRYVGASWGDQGNTFKVPDYTLVDAALRYDLGELEPDLKGLRLAVNVSNLFDEAYVSNCFRMSSCYYGGRRSVYATVSYRW